ncbi:MAG: endonuclease domain-containing protein [Elainellaceae cyanobacterium]
MEKGQTFLGTFSETVHAVLQMPKDSPRIRGTTREIEQAARRLRQNLTPAEAKLWSALKQRQLSGLKFRCQHPVGRFIVDFYCPAHKLIIEIDGAIHNQQKAYDGARTDHLQAFGYKVVRFKNEEVLENLSSVLTQIIKIVEIGSPQSWGAEGGNAEV